VKPRVLFAGDFRWGSGSSHVIAEYVRVAEALSAEVRVSSVLGSRDHEVTRHLPYEDNLGWATHLVIVLEGNPFLDGKSMDLVERTIPAHRRIVIDADGRSLPALRVGQDTNHAPHGGDSWARQFELAACPVICPRLAPRGSSRSAVPFSYFGMPPTPERAIEQCGLRYVGANWWRFDALIAVVKAFRQIDERSRVEVCGRYWDGVPRPGYEAATTAAVDVLDHLRVVTCPPVPFGTVVSSMSEAIVSPVLLRPVLSALGLTTPRVFETISAQTIPLFLHEDTAIADATGMDGLLCLGDDPVNDMARILGDVPAHRAIADELRTEMFDVYRYEAVFDRFLGQFS
jgi:hypothetical protein